MMFLHLTSQCFKRAELQLLDGSFTPPELLRDFPDTALLVEPALQDPPLILRQTAQQFLEQRLPFCLQVRRDQFQFIYEDFGPTGASLPAARD
jgi:hypothetical protein